MLNIEKSIFAIQPYKVGSNKSKSMAIVIPSGVIKKYNIDESTVFILKLIHSEKRLVFDIISETKNINNIIPAEKSFHASCQQVSREIH